MAPYSGGGSGILRYDAGPIIPEDRTTTWQPGVTYNGGIPNRTTIFTTLSPIGGASDDTAQIMTALNNAGAVATINSPQVVKLNAGVYNINGNGIAWGTHGSPNNYVTLRGSGIPDAMATGGVLSDDSTSALNYVSGTWLIKADRQTNRNYGILYVGSGTDRIRMITSAVALASDAIKGSTSCIVTSTTGLSVGQVVIVDQVTNRDPNVFWGNRHDLSGYFTGSLSGTSLTFTAPQNGPTGVDGSFNGTLSGTSLTINSSSPTGYIPQLAPGGNNPVGMTVFDASNNYYGSIASGTYPNFTLSQSNAGATLNLQLGGILPAVGYPIFDSVFSTFYGFITGGTFPNFTMGQSNPTLTGVTLTAGGGSRRFFSRQDRSITQMMRITNISGSTVTFETPFHYTFKSAFAAQIGIPDLSIYWITDGVSVEDLGMFGGMGGDGNGNLPMGPCINSWIKHVESYWSIGTGISMFGCYRCELRDSFMHESPDPNPGGAGYLSGMNMWTSDSLFENNIMWQGNKEIVMRSTGGGNVVAYNYMDDAFGGSFPESPEAGINAAHQGTPVFALLEGNCSQNFEADAFWGSSYCITIHRNWLRGIRSCSPTGDAPNIAPCNNLRAYTSVQGSITFPYGDYNGRRMADVQGNSLNHNFTGNVLGFSGQTLLTHSGGNYNTTQTTWVYENLDNLIAGDTNVIIWNLGAQQNPIGFAWITGTYKTVLRQGNFDWFTGTQKWHGIGGSVEYGNNPSAPFPTIPNSYYTGGVPPFFVSNSYGANTWPWVNPATGTTYKLPAKERFDAGTPNAL